MGKEEFEAMSRTGIVQANQDGVSYVARPANIEAFRSQARPGSLYVEFDVLSAALRPGGESGWAMIAGPTSWLAKYGKALDQMPNAWNIIWKASKL